MDLTKHTGLQSALMEMSRYCAYEVRGTVGVCDSRGVLHQCQVHPQVDVPGRRHAALGPSQQLLRRSAEGKSHHLQHT